MLKEINLITQNDCVNKKKNCKNVLKINSTKKLKVSNLEKLFKENNVELTVKHFRVNENF